MPCLRQRNVFPALFSTRQIMRVHTRANATTIVSKQGTRCESACSKYPMFAEWCLYTGVQNCVDLGCHV
jgi:hypothetical protein